MSKDAKRTSQGEREDRAAETTRAAKATVEAEAKAPGFKTAKLKAARLEREAEAKESTARATPITGKP